MYHHYPWKIILPALFKTRHRSMSKVFYNLYNWLIYETLNDQIKHFWKIVITHSPLHNIKSSWIQYWEFLISKKLKFNLCLNKERKKVRCVLPFYLVSLFSPIMASKLKGTCVNIRKKRMKVSQKNAFCVSIKL